MIAGICAGSITTLSSIIIAARGFVILTIVPIIIKFNLIGDEFSLALTIMSILFVIMILVSSQRLNQTIHQSLVFRYQRELAEQTIRYQAQYDDLTNLPNRRLFLSTLRQEMAKADRHHRYGAVFFIDLDRFKAVNDSLGHAVGDELLIGVANKIGERLRQEDTVARLGGDEFVVLLPRGWKRSGERRFACVDHCRRNAQAVQQSFHYPGPRNPPHHQRRYRPVPG